MRGRERTLRMFVGIYPPAAAAEAMIAELAGRDLARHRVVSPDALHMTLLFIGDRRPDEMEETIESVSRSAAGLGAFQITPRRMVTLPRRGEPRLVVIETDAPPTLLELRRRLVKRLARANDRSNAEFLPHFTVCRFVHGVKAAAVDEPALIVPFRVDAVRLMSSVLRADGADHREEAAFALHG